MKRVKRIASVQTKAHKEAVKAVGEIKEAVKGILRCGICDVDLSNMTDKEFMAHLQSKEHVEKWMDVRLDSVIERGKKSTTTIHSCSGRRERIEKEYQNEKGGGTE